MNEIMMVIIYILVMVLLSILIVLGIKGILAVDSLNETLKDINKKLHTFDGTFEFLDGVSNTLSFVNGKVISRIDAALSAVKKFRKDDKDE